MKSTVCWLGLCEQCDNPECEHECHPPIHDTERLF